MVKSLIVGKWTEVRIPLLQFSIFKGREELGQAVLDSNLELVFGNGSLV